MAEINTTVEQAIRRRFIEVGNPAVIPLQRRGPSQNKSTFIATLVDEGVMVTNLANLPLLPWAAFAEAVQVMILNGGQADRGDAMKSRLGDPKLSWNSVEGHVAHAVFDKQEGEAVFRRISPLGAILSWAGICQLRPGELVLTSLSRST